MQSARFIIASLSLIVIAGLVSASDPVALHQDLNNSSINVRIDAVKSLRNCTDPLAVDLLIPALHDESWIVRMEAAFSLGSLNDSRVVAPLLGALKDPDCDVRIEAIMALKKYQDPRAEDPLIQLLNDSNVLVRNEAAKALEKLKSCKAADYLIAELKCNDTSKRAGAAETLGLMNCTKAAEPLLQALRDNNTGVQASAAFALGRLKCQAAVMPLIELLQDNDSQIKLQATEALGAMKAEEAVDLLIRLLQDQRWYVRATAVQALGNINDSRAVESLISSLKDEDSFVRMKVVDSLGMTRNLSTIKPLQEILKDPDGRVRAHAATALLRINMTEAMRAIVSCLLYEADGQADSSSQGVFAPMYVKKVIIRADDISSNNQFVMFLSNLTCEKGFKTTYAVVPLWLDGCDKVNSENSSYLKGLDKDRFELATHGYDHISFEGLPYPKQLIMIKNATDLMERLIGRTPLTFVPPFHSYDLNTTKACSVAGYHTMSSGQISNQAYIENFGTGIMWEVDWDTVPVTISCFRDFADSFDRFYSSPAESLVILIHPSVLFRNASGGFSQKNAELFGYSIDYMISKGVDFATVEEAHQWRIDENAIRLSKASSGVYVVDMTYCSFNHTIKLNTSLDHVSDLSTGDLVMLSSERSFEGIKGKRYEVVLLPIGQSGKESNEN